MPRTKQTAARSCGASAPRGSLYPQSALKKKKGKASNDINEAIVNSRSSSRLPGSNQKADAIHVSCVYLDIRLYLLPSQWCSLCLNGGSLIFCSLDNCQRPICCECIQIPEGVYLSGETRFTCPACWIAEHPFELYMVRIYCCLTHLTLVPSGIVQL